MTDMQKNPLYPALFLAGLGATAWIGAGYIASNPLALSVVLLIGACYVAGALELHRYRQATATLAQALDALTAPPTALEGWLERLHPSLRSAARLRIEGERVALPAPSLAPYLVGLLVLLGMLGTLLGMMTTLRGTGTALESAMDLHAIRESLAAPVKGLAFAFGTSIAGVATSAMLGLLSALCKRERAGVVQRLDVAIATTLRTFSQSHQREAAFALLQRQVELMPALVAQLQATVTAMERQSTDANQRLVASQDAFHDKADATYSRLATTIEHSLKASVDESARAAGAVLQPAIEAPKAALAQKTASLHDTVTHAVQQQLDGLSAGFADTTTTVAGLWQDALSTQRERDEALNRDLRESLAGFADTFDLRSASLVESVSARLDSTAEHTAQAWNDALSRQQSLNDELASRNQQALVAATAAFEANATSLLGTLRQSHDDLQAALQSRDEQRLSTWADSFATMTQAMGAQWQQAGEDSETRQQAICDTLARTADDIAQRTKAHASDTIAEISRLVQTASEAPKAAADVIAELRQNLSDSMVRDNAMLDERNRLLATLQTLLDAVNHASTEQRASVDALIATSSELLERVGNRFAEQVGNEAGKLDAAADRVVAGAIEVAGLGDAFAAVVEQFGQSNEALASRLQSVEVALDRSLARSDEQLAYYVAQAREVVDLSLLSQKQIIDDLQRLADQRARSAEPA